MIVEVEEVQLIKVNDILKAGPKGNSEVVSLREYKTYYFPRGHSLSVFIYLQSLENHWKNRNFLTWSGTQLCRGFKVPDLLTCESKAQVIVSLGS